MSLNGAQPLDKLTISKLKDLRESRGVSGALALLGISPGTLWRCITVKPISRFYRLAIEEKLAKATQV